MTLRRAVLRLVGYLLSALPFYLGFLWVMGPRRMAWHDRLARTQVIYVRGPRELAAAHRAIAALACAVAGASLPTAAYGAAVADDQMPPPASDRPEPAARNGASAGAGADADADAGELAKQVQNPIANLISVPFQENLDYRIGPYDRARSTLNVQPVIPMQLSPGWMLISRIIVPFAYQPDAGNPGGGSSGLGDVNPNFYFSPVAHGPLIWGVGPAFLLPTATQRTIGQGKWAAGATGVALAQPHPWTIGVLATNVWNVAGPDDRPDVNQFTLQYFVNYNLARAWYLTSAPILTANWQAAGGDVWTVPLGAGVGKIFKIGKQPLNGSVAIYNNFLRPDTTPSPSWQLRVQLAFLFPTAKPPAKSSEVATAPRR